MPQHPIINSREFQIALLMIGLIGLILVVASLAWYYACYPSWDANNVSRATLSMIGHCLRQYEQDVGFPAPTLAVLVQKKYISPKGLGEHCLYVQQVSLLNDPNDWIVAYDAKESQAYGRNVLYASGVVRSLSSAEFEQEWAHFVKVYREATGKPPNVVFAGGKEENGKNKGGRH